MEHNDFKIGNEFTCIKKIWKCTDIGQRTIIAICLSDYKNKSWFNGPPYAVAEIVFDENDFGGCEPC